LAAAFFTGAFAAVAGLAAAFLAAVFLAAGFRAAGLADFDGAFAAAIGIVLVSRVSVKRSLPLLELDVERTEPQLAYSYRIGAFDKERDKGDNGERYNGIDEQTDSERRRASARHKGDDADCNAVRIAQHDKQARGIEPPRDEIVQG
jgi:hypothetical protein